ncbi:MAG: glutamine amidotransferase [Clostridia bacterium]|nr:glutamine amidotransferase [Clostridia bacterium]
MMHKRLVIGHLYPDLLNMYSDKGNIRTLTERLRQRGFEAEVIEFEKEDTIDFSVPDIVFLGGGSEREERLVLDKLLPYKKALSEYIEAEGVLLAVCGGYPLLGRFLPLMGEETEGLSALDIKTEVGEKRLIGNVVASAEINGEKVPVVGFENHSGRTRIGSQKSLGRVLYGHGNNGEDATCGVVYKNVIGTYLHGPLLPKNPKLADYLLAQALQHKYGEPVELSALNDEAELAAQQYIIDRFTKQ